MAAVSRLLSLSRVSPAVLSRCHISISQHVHPVSAADISQARSDRNRRYGTYHSGGARQSDGETSFSASIAAAVAALGFVGVSYYLKKTSECAKKEEDMLAKYGKPKPGLPVYRQADVEGHNTAEKRIWVTYREGVYDITDFINSHPGGKKILLAAGKGLEPFFQLFAVHKSEHAMEMMEENRIGNLHPDDLLDNKALDANDPYAQDPTRHPALRVNSAKPFNAETPYELLAEEYLTPNDIFFVRNHLPVPKADIKTHRVEIDGPGMWRPMRLTVDDLKKKFKTHSVIAAVQCTGNRRVDMHKVKAVKGLSWQLGAIGNAEWTGVKLVDVLKHCGVKEDDVKHVIFQGLDTDVEGVAYETSIPAETAFDERKDVLLAFQMNGEDIPLDHGYPLRVIVPGVAGARQVKWLGKIILSKHESTGHFQQNDYKVFNPSVDWSNVDFSKSPAIQDYPIQSAITEPLQDAVLEDNESVTVKGYAWSGGGRGINRVDISFDGGETWVDAELHKTHQKLHREWGWTLFEATYDIPREMHGKRIEIVCKAVDSSHNCQPETAKGIWNFRGLIHNAWHRVGVQVPED